MAGVLVTIRTCIICARKLQFKSIPLCLHEYWFTGAASKHHTPVSVLGKVHHLQYCKRSSCDSGICHCWSCISSLVF